MPHRGDPSVAVVGRGRQVHLDALGVHRGAQRRHVVLPADNRADSSYLGVEHGDRRAVALPPDESFCSGRDELAMLAQQRAIRTEEEDAAVEGSAVSFDDADVQQHSGSGSDLAEPVEGVACELQGAVPVAPVELMALGGAGADDGTEGQALGVAADEGLGEQDELGSFALASEVSRSTRSRVCSMSNMAGAS